MKMAFFMIISIRNMADLPILSTVLVSGQKSGYYENDQYKKYH